MDIQRRIFKNKSSPNVQKEFDPFYQKQLVVHQGRFRCAVCNVPSSGPAYVGVPVIGDEQEKWIARIESASPEEPDWDTPSDLRQCSRCGRFYCANHRSELSDRGCKQCIQEH